MTLFLALMATFSPAGSCFMDNTSMESLLFAFCIHSEHDKCPKFDLIL